MANQYSVEIHKYISAKIAAATSQIKKPEIANNTATRRFYEGQLYELGQLRQYMAQNIDLKTQKYY